MEKRCRFDIGFFIRAELFESLIVLRVEHVDVVFIPFNLIVVDVVILPHDSQIVAAGIGMAVKYIERLGYDALAVFDVYNLVAVAVNVLRTGLEQAVFKAAVLIEIGDILAGIVAVSLCVVVAERQRPVNAELLHESGKNLCGGKIVQRSRFVGDGERNISGHDHKVRLLLGNHGGNGIESHGVLFKRQPTASDMYVRELKNFKIPVCCKSPIAVFILLRNESILFFDRCNSLSLFGVCFVSDNADYCRYRTENNYDCKDDAENLEHRPASLSLFDFFVVHAFLRLFAAAPPFGFHVYFLPDHIHSYAGFFCTFLRYLRHSLFYLRTVGILLKRDAGICVNVIGIREIFYIPAVADCRIAAYYFPHGLTALRAYKIYQ